MTVRPRVGPVILSLVLPLGCRPTTDAPTAPTRLTEVSSSALAIAHPQAAACDDDLMRPVEGPEGWSQQRGVVRGRLVALDVPSLRARAESEDRLEMALFDDVCVVGRRESLAHEDEGRLVWTGVPEDGHEESRMVVVIAEDVVTASIRVSGPRFYRVQYAGGGVHAVTEVSPAGFPPD